MKITPVVSASNRRPGRLLAVGMVAAVALVAGACTHHPGHPRPTHFTWPPATRPGTRPTVPTTPAPTANEVTFVLKNGAIELQGEVKPGKNTVHVTNEGTVEHEVIFIAAESGTTLPTSPNGAVDEAKLPPGSDIGEVELGAGASATRTFTFKPGKWVAVCNVVSGTNVHFAKGMWMDFSVS
jgi:plastocyanin